ncbi:hypothetical protein [Infirmifilum sp. SLHALR2]|nr:MAG: hypothetical protein B7L53_09515 [Thermofilum sp. NZ13]
MSQEFKGLLESNRVQAELRDFEEWFKKYGEHILEYEESKLVIRTAWLARVMLDEGYALFPGQEEGVRTFVASFIADKLRGLGVDPRQVTRGDLHGTRQDVVEVVTRIYPNVQQTDRPSVTSILQQELAKPPKVEWVVVPALRVERSRARPLVALLLTLLLSSLLIILLSR